MNSQSNAEYVWDAGPLSCGELVIELKRRIRLVEMGKILHVIATDPAAPIDIGAWCRLTGYTLFHKSPPNFYILRNKE